MASDELINRIKGYVIRHRVSLQDLSLVIAATLTALYVVYDVDVFVSDYGDPVRHTLEADELPIIGAVLCLGMLIFAWRRSREQKREHRKRIFAERHARELALQDPLTGLPNRRRFNDALGSAVAAPPRAGSAHAVFMIDLNGFKQVNDIHGHGVGDRALIVVGERLLGEMRDGDIVARLGGDEFAVLAYHVAGAEAATGVALRLIEAITKAISLDGISYQLGGGVGICLLPFAGNTPEEAMRRADVALYKAKAERKSALRFFDADLDRHVRERAFLERELREAVARSDIQPFFQPLVDLSSSKVVGFEALARWHHAQLGELPPDRFIPLAEDCGLIQELTDQLLLKACTAARQWPDHTMLAFNISPVQLKDRTLGLRVLNILGKSGLPPTRLEIEITESALVRDMESAQEVLGSMREAGVRIALDDFGTGYSSLYHLRNFKIDKIKIDRSFVSGMGNERESTEIVNALIGLGRGLGLTVTAEGIEAEDQQSGLIAKGCQLGQGFLFGKAMTAAEALRLCDPAPERMRADASAAAN